jgi:hypothetical protein
VPKVTRISRCAGLLACFVVACNLEVAAQLSSGAALPGIQAGPAETLYQRLRTVGLDRSRVYRVREASLNRASLHVTLNDGTIAFTEDVAGRVTGAFFAGDGEVLLMPPGPVERSSMTRFTGAAILEEKFSTAYLRFNDDTLKELQPSLIQREHPEEFIAQWNDSAQDLAEADALRLFVSFSRFLPSNNPAAPDAVQNSVESADQMLHLRAQGRKLGAFDVFFDLAAMEQISAGQLRNVGGKSYYDVWTSFAFRKERETAATAEIAGEEEDHGEIEVSNYKISAQINPPTQLDAEARLRMLVRRGGERVVLFELSRYLKVREVEADGRPIEFIHNPALEGTQLARRGDDVVAVVFTEPLRTGQEIELHFAYGGSVLSEAGSGLLYVGARGTWYPNRGFVNASFDMDFRYPGGWTLIATGKREDETAVAQRGEFAAAPNTQVSRWVSERPIPVAGFNLGKYARVSKHAGPVTVDVYAASGMERGFPQISEQEVLPPPPFFPPGQPVPAPFAPLPPSPAGNAQLVADDAVRAVTFFARRFGPYPYEGLAVTQMPGSQSQGWPGLIFLSSFSFLSPGQKLALHIAPTEKMTSDAVVAHETAHQWWGDLVTWSGYRDQWIVEGLANYSSLLLLESDSPSQFRALMTAYRDDLLRKNKDGTPVMDAGPVTLGARLSNSQFPDGYETIAYERGTWLFHMLRTMMRDAEQKNGARARTVAGTPDEPFLRALRTLRERYQGRPIATHELMRVFEEELPPAFGPGGRKSLDWFYEGWVNGTAIPELELRSLKYTDKPGATTVSGMVKQKDADETLITSVPIYASVAGRTVLLGRVFADGLETQFHLIAPAGTRKVLLDPNQTVLSRFH